MKDDDTLFNHNILDHNNLRNPILEVKNIRKSFGSFEVLKDISLIARQHDVISIIGSSGSGKSTFLRCINFLEIADSGSVAISGEEVILKPVSHKRHPLNSRQIRRLRAKMAMVFQNFNLWSHLSIIDNITLAPRKILGLSKQSATEKAEYLLNKVGLYEKRFSYPGQLSGGQQQRSAIIRALIMDPQLLLFDEPTSSLDPHLVGEVLSVMRNLSQEGRTMILVTHEISFAREVSSHIIYLNQGKIAEQGTPEEIFDNPDSLWSRHFSKNAPISL